MKKLGEWIQANWLLTAIYGMVTAVVCALLWFRLTSLLPGMSAVEMTQYGATATIDVIAHNPLYLPQKLLQLSGLVFGLQPVMSLRVASTLLGVLVAAALYYVLRVWYSQRIALLGTALYLTSSWFLFTARHGSTAIMYSCLFLAFASVVWIQQSRASAKSITASAIVLTSLLYIPGMVWFIMPILVWRFGWLRSHIKDQKKPLMALLVLCGIAALAPLVFGLYRQPELLRTYLGLPEALPSIQTYAKNVLLVPIHIFAKNSVGYETHLGTLPHVSASVALLTLVGLYAYVFKRRLDRTWSLAYIFIIGTLLVALQGSVQIAVLLPFVFLIAAGGVALMLQQWFTVFPYNPFARTVGLVLLLFALGTTSFYSLNQYFVAWPHTPETKQTFQYRP